MQELQHRDQQRAEADGAEARRERAAQAAHHDALRARAVKVPARKRARDGGVDGVSDELPRPVEREGEEELLRFQRALVGGGRVLELLRDRVEAERDERRPAHGRQQRDEADAMRPKEGELRCI